MPDTSQTTVFRWIGLFRILFSDFWAPVVIMALWWATHLKVGILERELTVVTATNFTHSAERGRTATCGVGLFKADVGLRTGEGEIQVLCERNKKRGRHLTFCGLRFLLGRSDDDRGLSERLEAFLFARPDAILVQSWNEAVMETRLCTTEMAAGWRGRENTVRFFHGRRRLNEWKRPAEVC